MWEMPTEQLLTSLLLRLENHEIKLVLSFLYAQVSFYLSKTYFIYGVLAHLRLTAWIQH